MIFIADKIYERSSRDTISAVGSYIKGKIPTVDSSVTQESGNAVSSAAVYAYVAEKIAGIGGVSFKMADSLPESGDGRYIYLVPKSTAEMQNGYDEYIWYDSAWELIGSADIDLSDYVRSSDMHEITADEIILDAVWGVN